MEHPPDAGRADVPAAEPDAVPDVEPAAEPVIRVREPRPDEAAAIAGPCGEAHAVRDEQLFILYVLAAHQRRGLGGALLEAVLGDRPAQLWVAEGSTRALDFYRWHGFAPDGATELDESFGPRELRMVR